MLGQIRKKKDKPKSGIKVSRWMVLDPIQKITFYIKLQVTADI